MVDIILYDGRIYREKTKLIEAMCGMSETLDNGFPFIGIETEDATRMIRISDIKEIVEVKEIKADITSEDLNYLRALTQMKIDKNYLADKIHITISLDGAKITDTEEFANKLKKILQEELKVSANGCY